MKYDPSKIIVTVAGVEYRDVQEISVSWRSCAVCLVELTEHRGARVYAHGRHWFICKTKCPLALAIAKPADLALFRERST